MNGIVITVVDPGDTSDWILKDPIMAFTSDERHMVINSNHSTFHLVDIVSASNRKAPAAKLSR